MALRPTNVRPDATGKSSVFRKPVWGVADCPSAGHDMLCLDYSTSGAAGEPTVVHVDQEHNYRITFVAQNFETFIRGLEDDEAFAST